MSMFDTIMSQMADNPALKNLGEKVGLSPEQMASAVAALTAAHPQPGDTVDTAAQQSGLPAGQLSQVLEHLGGEGALSHLAGSLLGGGEAAGGAGGQAGGGMLGGLAGLAGGLFGGTKHE